jgi:peptidoglycan/LPS O-acetylase OafA/YrhL
VDTSPQQTPDAPLPLLVAAVVVALEGLGTAVYGIAEALHTTSSRVVMGTTTSLFFVVYGAGMLVCAWGLRRVRTWARGPVLLVQLISLGLAWNFHSGSTLPLTFVLGVPAVVALVAMLHPATIAALNPPYQGTGD